MKQNIAGNFKILELPDAFQLLLNRYYPAYINKMRRNINIQDFTFDVKTKNISEYIGLFSKKITGFNNTNISGNINSSSNILQLKADIPLFNYSNIDFTNVNFTGTGTYDTLTLAGNIGDVIINDSLHLPDTKILVKAANDISEISIKTTASQTLNEADLSLQLQTLSDGFRLNFNPSSFVINDKKWILEKGGELTLSKNLLTASEVKFVQNEQQIIISTEPSSINNSNDVLVDLVKINIGEIVPFFIRFPKFEGLMTGQVKINDPFGNMSMGFVTDINQFRFENDSIGILKTFGNYSSVTGEIVASANSNNADYNFIADVTYKTKDSTTNQLNGSLNLDKSNIHFLQKYLNTIFTGIQGNATGQLNITGRGNDPKITGSVALNDASLTVNYTRVKYYFNDNSILKFNKDEIDFGKIKIRDTLNNTATVSGKLYHTFFDNFYFNELNLKTDRSNGLPAKFLLINTTAKDNNEFYGFVIGDAEMQLDGPITDMRMNITGQPTDSSHIYLPTGDVAETGKIDYIDFIKFGREMGTDVRFREETNIKVNMDITANPFAKIDVILDETTGDVIKAQGSGKLNINVGTQEPLSIRGRYVVEEGQYTFNFQTFLKTPFILQSGFIEWQGDPYLANLNIDAVYRATQVDLSSIATSGGSNNAKGDVDVIFKLRGTLKDPRPEFEFSFPFDNPLRSDPIANQFLKTRYESDRNVMNKQVTSLLLFNSFISDEQNLFSANNTGNFVFRTVGQILSNTLSSSLNNWLQKLLKTDQVNLYTNINTSDFNFDGTQKQLQNLGNFGFKTAFLKNRLLLNFGGNVDYNFIAGSSNSNTNFLFTPDVSFEYLVTPGGSVRVVGFNRSDADLGDIAGVTRRNRTGILLSYRKDFNNFYELFGIGKK
ncbi:MAG: translocation/assembly module TamB domain-containing protein [Chitinophagaceae bacterium]